MSLLILYLSYAGDMAAGNSSFVRVSYYFCIESINILYIYVLLICFMIIIIIMIFQEQDFFQFFQQNKKQYNIKNTSIIILIY